jgi:murein DD-endopeptidase MepM/ murein hydrolase activator NlpD
LKAGIVLSSLVLFVLILFIYSLKLNFDNIGLKNLVSEYGKQVEYADSIKLSEKLKKIDENISVVDSYLKSRGIIGQQNIGGENTEKKISNSEMLRSLEDQSVVFLNLIKNIPVGYPHSGPVSSVYGYRRNPFGGYCGEFHNGIDLKGDYNEPVYATADGIVNRCDWYGGYGNAVVLDHGFGYQTLYGHMSRVNVNVGQEVKSGDLIGFIGSTGRSTGPHVHYEIRKDGIDIDPSPYLKIN